MKINYNNRNFRPVSNSDNAETTNKTIFKYKQKENVLTSEYSGGKIRIGHLIGLVNNEGHIEMRYHQINIDGKIMTAICFSKPELMANGKIRLYEKWQWTSGNKSCGESILEEV